MTFPSCSSMRRRASDGKMERWNVGMGFRFSILAVISLSTVPSFHLSAQELPLNAGALFLVFPVGAQAVGMGQTAIAASGRGDAAFWNPAGLATLSDDEFSLHSASLVAGRSNVLGAYFPSRGIGVIGGAVYLVDYGDLDRTDINGNTIARIAPRNFEFLASYATNLTGSIAFGINYKLVQFRVDCSGDCRDFPAGTGVTHGLDLGGQFSVGPGGPLRIGVALRNIGFRLQVNNQAQADPLPTRLAVGAIYELRLRPVTGRTLDQAFDLKVAADVDSPWGQAGQSETRLGLDSGSLGIDLARAFLTGSDLQVESPTFFSFRVSF